MLRLEPTPIRVYALAEEKRARSKKQNSEEWSVKNVDLGRLAVNVGVTGLLLGGIVVCVVQGYNGYLSLQDDTVSPTRVKPYAPVD